MCAEKDNNLKSKVFRGSMVRLEEKENVNKEEKVFTSNHYSNSHWFSHPMIGNPVDELKVFSSFSSAQTKFVMLQNSVFSTNAKGSSAARTVSPVATEWVKSLLYKVMIIVVMMVVTMTRRMQKQPTTQVGRY